VLSQDLFKLKYYNDLDGGILEGFGRLLKFDLKIYVYPTLDTKTGEVITAKNVKVRISAAQDAMTILCSFQMLCGDIELAV
jgi:hypothetical protein